MRSNARRTSRLCEAGALLAAVWMLAITAGWASPWVNPTAPHHPHAAAASHDSGAAVLVDHHPHLEAKSDPAPLRMVTAAVPPRTVTMLTAIGLVAALAAVATLFARLRLPTMRGPPRALAALPTGQQTVTLFCIARR